MASWRAPRSAMKSMAAAVPAMPSWFCVPVSQMYGGSCSCVRRRRGSSISVASLRAYRMPMCGPKNL